MARLVRGVAEMLREYRVTKQSEMLVVNPVERMVQWARRKEVKTAAEALTGEYGTLVAGLQALLPKFQEVFLCCSRSSDDDNLSRSGQTFVFLEAMPGAAGNLADGRGKVSEGEDGEPQDEGPAADEDREFFDEDPGADDVGAARGNWLNEHAILRDRTSGDESATRLHPEVEEGLKRLLTMFAQLTPAQARIVHGLLNRHTLKQIADELGTSKQNCGNWFREAKRRFPALIALSPKQTRVSACR